VSSIREGIVALLGISMLSMGIAKWVTIRKESHSESGANTNPMGKFGSKRDFGKGLIALKSRKLKTLSKMKILRMSWIPPKMICS